MSPSCKEEVGNVLHAKRMWLVSPSCKEEVANVTFMQRGGC